VDGGSAVGRGVVDHAGFIAEEAAPTAITVRNWAGGESVPRGVSKPLAFSVLGLRTKVLDPLVDWVNSRGRRC